jgi:protease-4
VAENRGVATSDIDAVAQGRIWSGVRAHELHLVDHLGGLLDALARARELAGLTPDEPIRLLRLPETGLLGFLTGLVGLQAEAQAEQLAEWQGVLDLLGLTPAFRLALLYGNGEPAARLELELTHLE